MTDGTSAPASTRGNTAMSPMQSGGRRGTSAAFAAIFAATMITSTACGTSTGSNAQDPVTVAPAAVHRGPFPAATKSHPATSADAAERRGQSDFAVPPAGMRVPD